ncbi:MFS transporter [Micromonospora carbonacea]|uniref:MFS transporter n=1 Tax=Micromonospora carbonacea TaxID=47853 RepID=A0A7H8XJG1_9ACTN|nr:MFS transporter [Micromonospora carbonacea]MBB5828443.1 MFS family permease [Micromonospora carbonacea]QLD23952.1 MFS transporter [Micromonospora carbonacea]
MTAFRDGRFRRLYIGDALSGFGDTALLLALGIWVKDLTGSNSAAGVVFLAMGLPVLFAPLAGRQIDRVRRKTLLMVTNGIAGLVVLALLGVRSAEDTWIIYAVAIVHGCVATVLTAGRNALLKDLLPDRDLPSANAAFGTLFGFTRILAPLVGSGIYAAFGGHLLALIDALTFLAAITALASVRVAESPPEPTGERFGTELLAGLRHIRSVPLLSQVTLVSAVAFGSVGFLEPIIFVVVEDGLHRPAAFFGVIVSVQGIGSIAAGFTGAWLLRRVGEARAIGGALVGLGLGCAALAVGATPVVLGGAIGIGLAVTWFSIGWNTLLQRHTPSRLLGRVFTTAGMLVTVPQTACIGVAAVLIGVVDYRVLLAVLSLVILLSGLRLLTRPKPTPGPADARADQTELEVAP